MNVLRILVVVLLISTGCNRQTYTATTTTPQKLRHASKKKENAVKIYHKYQEAPKNAKQIGVMSSSSFNTEKVAIKVRNFAARSGGDIAVFVDRDEMRERSDHESNTYVSPGLLLKKYNYIILKSQKEPEE
jgi:hypothetical protein